MARETPCLIKKRPVFSLTKLRHEIVLKTKGELTTAIALIKEFLLSDEAKEHDQDYLDKLALIVEVGSRIAKFT